VLHVSLPVCSTLRHFDEFLDITDAIQDYSHLLEFLVSLGHLPSHIGPLPDDDGLITTTTAAAAAAAATTTTTR